MENRLAKIEEKLDKIHEDMQEFIKASTMNKSDISWLKGITKVNFTMLSTTVLGLMVWALKSLMNK